MAQIDTCLVMPERIHAPFQSSRPQPRISIIIPCFDEEAHIGACLASLTHLNIPPAEFEVLLVDNGSKDRTLEIATAFETFLNLTIAQLPGVTISALRNHGSARAAANILAFLDADCIAPSTWLDHVPTLLSDSGIGLIGSPYDIPQCSSWIAKAWESQRIKERRSVKYVPGGDLIIPRTIFQQFGGFDESIETNEDAELCQRVRSSGLAVVADPQLAVIHMGTAQTLLGFYRKQRWHGTHVLKVFLRSPRTSGNEKAVLFALYVLVTELCILCGLWFAVATGSWQPLWLSILLMFAPAAMLGAQRALSSRRWSDFPGLFALYSVYGFARAHCLFRVPRRP